MSDFNMVNVQSQSQIGKSVDTTKLHMLTLDVKDFTAFLPILKELQNTSSKIVKELNPVLAKKDKKTISLPYNLLKKFQTLKDNLVESQKVLEFQGRLYSCSVANRDYEKIHEQQFYRKTLKSYDEKRLWMKQYIHNNETIVQNVEEQVKRNIDYETHKFTEFRRELNVERLEHNYQEKLESIEKNVSMLHANNLIRDKIKAKLANIQQKKKTKLQQHNSDVKRPERVDQVQKLDNKLLRVPNFTPFLQLYFAKKAIKNHFLAEQVYALNKKLSLFKHSNQELKLAMDKIRQQIESENLQVSISLHQVIEHDEKIAKMIPKSHKVTKTDFFLYQKQMQRHCQQILSVYGNYFQYAFNSQVFPNHLKSKSAAKFYKVKAVSQPAQAYAYKLLIQNFKQYAHQNIGRIVQEKKVRQSRKEQPQSDKPILKQMKNRIIGQQLKSIQQSSLKILQEEDPQQMKPGQSQIENHHQQRETYKQVENKGNNKQIVLDQQEFTQI